MRLLPSLRLASVTLTLTLTLAACGDDDGSEGGAETTPETSTSPTSSTAAEPDTGTSAATDDGTTATLDDTGTTAVASSEDGTTATGPTGDPTYPPMEDGACPQGTLPVMLPGSQLCAPFCDGPGEACPPAASGDAVPTCVPFAGPGGSGAACDDAMPCPEGETCDDGACAEVAFFACQLLCGMGEACPDDMACSGIGTCGYP